MRNAGTQAALNDRNGVPTPKVTQYELGFKTADEYYSAYINGFYTDFTGISFQQITTTARAELGERFARARRGIRSGAASGQEPAADPDRQLAGIGIPRQSCDRRQRTCSASRNCNTASRRATAFRWATTSSSCTARTPRSASRWADQANLSYLPSYKTFDAGVLAPVGRTLGIAPRGDQPEQRTGPDGRQFAPDRRAEQRPDQCTADFRARRRSLGAVPLLSCSPCRH